MCHECLDAQYESWMEEAEALRKERENNNE
jgi:hypothetical protein